MGSDTSLKKLLPIIQGAVISIDDPEADIPVDPTLRDIPDLYLMTEKWHPGPKYHQHLIVELKRPSVRIVGDHIEQLKRYARQIVSNPIFGQRSESHQFTFVVVSSQVSDSVVSTEYQSGEEPGLISRPRGLGHPTELLALRWSDLLDRRSEELTFLKEQIEIQADPTDLDYLRKEAAGFLPEQANT